MSGHTVRLLLPAEPAVVFPYLVLPDLQREWMSSLVESRRLTTGPLTVGSRIRDVVEAAGRRLTFETTVTQLVEPHRYEARMVAKGVEVDARYLLHPHDEGTKLHYDADTRFTTFAMKLLAGTIERKARQTLDDDFARLLAIFE